MKKLFSIMLALTMVVYFGGLSFAVGEHGGKEGVFEHGGKDYSTKEHGGIEHGGKEMKGSLMVAGEHGGKEHGGAAKSTEESGAEHGGKKLKGSAGDSKAAFGGKEHGGAAKKAEHGGKTHAAEHGGKEHGGAKASTAPSADDIRGAMKSYVLEKSAASGSFDVKDTETGKTRRLALIRVHERVGKTGDYYYSCADFKDLDSGELLDLDLDVADNNGVLSVADVRIHKVSGKRRYTYDENDNRIPLNE